MERGGENTDGAWAVGWIWLDSLRPHITDAQANNLEHSKWLKCRTTSLAIYQHDLCVGVRCMTVVRVVVEIHWGGNRRGIGQFTIPQRAGWGGYMCL